MNLYLLRHGKAEDRAATDAARALTGEGRRQVVSTAGQFRARGLAAARCLASPYVRARQSAETFLQTASLDLPIEECPLLCPDTRPSELLRFLQAQPEADILLVGHNPLLSEFCALLRDGHLDAVRCLGTGELAGLSLPITAQGFADRLFHLVPDPAGAASW